MPVLQVHEWFKNKKEFKIIKKYQMKNDLSILTDALRDLKNPSHVMRRSIAAIFEGNELFPHYKSVPRAKPKYIRNLKIAFKVHQYSEEIGHLTENRDGKGAIEEVANEEKDLKEDSVKKIYYSYAPVIERLILNSPEGCDDVFDMITASVEGCCELVDMITASFKGFDEACLYIIKPYVNEERIEAVVTKTAPPD